MERREIKRISEELDDILERTALLDGGDVKAAEPYIISENQEDDPKLHLQQADGQENADDGFNHKGVRRRSRRVQPQTGWIKPSDGLAAAFFVPVLIMLIIFAQREIFPFGEESFLRTDMYHQYAPFFSEFRDKLRTGGSLLYSWDIGMGINFAALYAYYLASPMNWLLILCPRGLIIEFMTYSIVLKIGLSGLSFAYYLRKHCGTKDFGVAFFGIFYALSGYMAAYSWNIMWLDCIILFPLIVLGLEQLVKKRKCLLYCITLGVSITSNYYISIMICIFLVLYFAALLIMEGKKGIKHYAVNVMQFSAYSLLAGGMAAVVLIPEIFALQMTASGDFSFPKTFSSYFSIFDMLARHIGNVKTETGLDHWPNIYCGVAILMFFLLYLGCKKISVKEKVVYCTFLMIFFASFSFNVLNFSWHGFHDPNSLPCRQSFIYIFLILVMGYQAYRCLKDIPWKHIVISFWGAVIFVLLAQKLVTQSHFHFIVYYVAILFLALYLGIIYLFKMKKCSCNIALLLALSLVAVEAAVNTTVTSVTTTSRTSYIRDNEDVRSLTAAVRSDESFYRVEKIDRKTKNDGSWMNFPSVSLFSSMANADLTAFFKSLGCEGSANAYSITGSTPLVDALFSVKYALYSSRVEDNSLMRFLDSQGDTYLYENLYTLPVGFMVPYDFEETWQTNLQNPADVQNNLANVAGASPVLISNQGTADAGTYRFTAEEDGDFYVYVTNKRVKKVEVTLNDTTESFDNVNRGFFLELGYLSQGQEITLKAEEEKEQLDAQVYRFSDQGLMSVYDQLIQRPLQVTKWTDTVIEGIVESDRDGLLFTTIPFDKGWKVTVDGTEQTTRKIKDTFLSIYLPKGNHTLTFTYTAPGLHLGAAITGTCLGLLLIISLVSHRKKKNNENKRRQSE